MKCILFFQLVSENAELQETKRTISKMEEKVTVCCFGNFLLINDYNHYITNKKYKEYEQDLKW